MCGRNRRGYLFDPTDLWCDTDPLLLNSSKWWLYDAILQKVAILSDHLDICFAAENRS